MSQSNDTRSSSYHGWSRIVAIVLAILLAILWWVGRGPNSGANCCGKGDAAVAVAPVVAATPATPVVAEVKPPPPPMPAVDAACEKAFKTEVGFNTGSSQLSAAGVKALDAIIACKVKAADIVGHSDNVGGAALNLALSERRATIVAGYLNKKGGVATDRLTVKGMGETQPRADNATAEGRAQNRRIEVTAK